MDSFHDLALHTVWVFAFIALIRIALRCKRRLIRSAFFAAVNILAMAALYAAARVDHLHLVRYLIAVIILYILLRLLSFTRYWSVASIAPVGLILAKCYGPSLSVADTAEWLGLSYLGFRVSQMVIVVRNNLAPLPGLFDFLGYAFFAPTMLVGPINSYATHYQCIENPKHELTPFATCLMRAVVGIAKVIVLSNLAYRLSYKSFLLDGHPHQPVDLIVAMIAYYLYIYCNFSGVCDIVIGISGMCNIKVSENFSAPLSARNIKEFWNRWHITLYSYMRDMVFAPVSKFLVSMSAPNYSQHAIAAAIVIVFVLIGIWHGGLGARHYIVYALLNAAGVVGNMYYGNFLKRVLSKEQLRAYAQSRIIQVCCTAITFVFVAASFFFFDNDFKEMHQILSVIRW